MTQNKHTPGYEVTAKSTPGPWKYHLGRGAKPRFHIQTEGGYQIASTPELTTPHTAKLAIEFDENQVREANARLIAAAPDLLLALEMISESCPLNPELAAIARAALSKAK